VTMNALEVADVREHVRRFGIPLFGESAAFLALLRKIERVASRGAATVLIRGETGTGKELVARAIHYLGARRDFPFVPVNCGALPESLAENELFGHRRGAFTGATEDSAGLLGLAHRGTLFLDEVDALPAKAQAALLRFLQDGIYRPLGGAREERADVRIVSASNRCLEQEIAAGRFRNDLFYRLNLLSMEVPPLRERPGDVRVLSRHFLRQCAERYKLPDKRLHEYTVRWFDQYGWPGNIRELENLIHREYVLCDDAELSIAVPAGLEGARRPAPHADPDELPYRSAKLRAVHEFNHAYLTQLMRRTQGNVTRAAEISGKERRALGKLLKRYSIARREDQDLAD
jgi:DNA-binding NtrC family response regulator